jgi:transposase
MFKPVPKEIREQILSRIKNDGVTAPKAAADAGVSSITVYGWLAKESEKTNCNQLELSRLRREIQGLHELVGQLTAEIHKSKRGRL